MAKRDKNTFLLFCIFPWEHNFCWWEVMTANFELSREGRGGFHYFCCWTSNLFRPQKVTFISKIFCITETVKYQYFKHLHSYWFVLLEYYRPLSYRSPGKCWIWKKCVSKLRRLRNWLLIISALNSLESTNSIIIIYFLKMSFNIFCQVVYLHKPWALKF